MSLYLNIGAHIEFSYQSKWDNVHAQIYWNKADDNLLQWQGINTDQNQVKIKDLLISWDSWVKKDQSVFHKTEWLRNA